MQKQYYRTFIALPVIAGEDLMKLHHEIKTALSDERISWVDPANFHITLRFLGNTSQEIVENITSAMELGRFTQNIWTVPVKGVRSFGPAKKPRVIWAALGQEQWFREMKADVDRYLEGLGLPTNLQGFTAHLTLGRIRSLKKVSAYHAYMQEIITRVSDPVRIDKMVYYQSILGSGAPEYRKLAEVKFKKKLAI